MKNNLMKKRILVLLAASLLSLTACGGSGSSTQTTTAAAETQAATPAGTEAAAEAAQTTAAEEAVQTTAAEEAVQTTAAENAAGETTGTAAEQAGQTEDAEETTTAKDTGEWKPETIGELINGSFDTMTSSYDHKRSLYLGTYRKGDQFVRVYSNVPKDIMAQLWKYDTDPEFMDKGYEEREEFIRTNLYPLSIDVWENMTDQALSQEDRDALIGKTVQELIDEGFAFNQWGRYSSEEKDNIISLDYGLFSYEVELDGTYNPSSYTWDELLPMTVTKIEPSRISSKGLHFEDELGAYDPFDDDIDEEDNDQESTGDLED